MREPRKYAHDDLIVDVRVALTKRVPSWLETLAVTTPWGGEGDHDVLFRVLIFE